MPVEQLAGRTLKIALIGAAGVRTPLLLRGLQNSDLPVAEFALFDIDATRLDVIAALVRDVAPHSRLTIHKRAEAAIEGADFVITSIRPGGIATRARDERVCLDRGVVGQETCGAVGFAMAMRCIPPMIEYARLAKRHAPKAWMVSFTNPVGIVTQAALQETEARFIGICDTPTELFAEVAAALAARSNELEIHYMGLNHLGFVTDVRRDGESQMPKLLADDEALRRLYRAPLFDPSRIRNLGAIPTEYLFYYFETERAIANLKSAGNSRGEAIAQMNDRLFEELTLATTSVDRVALYERYLAARDLSYMQTESGGAARRSPLENELTGYDKIALSVIRAIAHDRGDTIPLDVANHGTIAELSRLDCIETPCAVDKNGPHPLHRESLPEGIRDLVLRVKEYERATVKAALSRSPHDAVQALSLNPLVPDVPIATQLVDALEILEPHPPHVTR